MVYFITVEVGRECPTGLKLVETSEKSSLGRKEKHYQVLREKNWTYFPRFCIFIINHLLCWPELWKRSSVHYFFKRSFLCFLKVCAPFFVFVTKQRNPDFVSLTLFLGEEIKKQWKGDLARVAERLEVERETRMLFLTQKQTQVFSPVTWSKAPKGASIDWWPSIHARLELVPFFKAKNLDSLL